MFYNQNTAGINILISCLNKDLVRNCVLIVFGGYKQVYAFNRLTKRRSIQVLPYRFFRLEASPGAGEVFLAGFHGSALA